VTTSEGRAGVRRSPRRVLSYADAVAGARAHFLRNATINMDELADELGVGRATLYRLIEGRDRLLGDVLWSLAAPLLAEFTHTTSGHGVDKIIGISMGFYRALLRPGPFREFLAKEPETALRVLCTPAGQVHERTVRAQKVIFSAVGKESDLHLPDDLDGLAYLYVRIVESLLYADLISGRTPQLAMVERAARAALAG
jgi:AcrR family transcriptional regulator